LSKTEKNNRDKLLVGADGICVNGRVDRIKEIGKKRDKFLPKVDGWWMDEG
jgi:hypothetical protein